MPPRQHRGSSPDDDPTGVRALLSSLPEPGPMPPELVARITASLSHEQEMRAGEVDELAARRRPRRLHQVLTLGGAAAAVAVIGTVVVLQSRTPPTTSSAQSAAREAPAAAPPASTGSAAASSQPTGGGGSTPYGLAAGGRSAAPGDRSGAANGASLHIQMSGTAYTRGNLLIEARARHRSISAPLAPNAAQSPGIGPVGTPTGLTSCLHALGQKPVNEPGAVWADLASFDGQPAAVIVVRTAGSPSPGTSDPGGSAGSGTVWAVGRDCRPGHPFVLAGPTPLP